MKYECTMCGSLVEASSPPTSCEACGNDEFREKAFDVKCPLCGRGYYSDAKPNFCSSCGYRLSAPPRVAPVKKVPPPPPEPDPVPSSSVSTSSSSGSGHSVPRRSKEGGGCLKFIGWLIGVALVLFLVFIIFAWFGDIIRFLFRHWVIVLIVLAIIGGASKT